MNTSIIQTSETINAISKRYDKISLWIIAGLTLIVLCIMSIIQSTSMLNALIVSALYSLILCKAYGITWKNIAKSSPVTIHKFYLVAATIRMLSAVIVALIYCLIVKERTEILLFVSIFAAFYIAILIFDSIFFIKIEKNNKTLEK